ncbi:MFS transporter [Zavarzinia sp. CC-PAN008]|uniref:MFS transporter n=1 Tax=Zavarzinia sp. CC-PAN008 TaxID=3243332 RepID=UPI003F74489E
MADVPGWWLTLAFGLCGFGSSMGIRALDPVVPYLMEHYGVSVHGAVIAASGFSLAYGFGQLVNGLLADRYGRFRVMSIALLGTALFSFVPLVLSSFPALVAARVAAGFCGSAVIPSALATIGQRLEPGPRAIAIARFMTAVITGQLLGAVATGQAAASAGLSAGFLILTLSPLPGFVLLLTLRRMPELNERVTGSLTHVAVMMRTTTLPWLALFGFLEGALVLGAIPFVSVFLDERLGLGADAAAWAVATYSIGGVLFTLVVTAAVRLFGDTMFLWGAVASGLAWVVLPHLPSFALVIAVMLLTGFAFNAMHNTLQTAASTVYPPARATGMSYFAFALFLGVGLGPLAFQAVRDAVGLDGAFLTWAIAVIALGLASRKAPLGAR